MKWFTARNRLWMRLLAVAALVSIWVFFSRSELSYTKPVDITSVKEGNEKSLPPLSSAVPAPPPPPPPQQQQQQQQEKQKTEIKRVDGSIMPSMPDLEAKQELGRASWKYLHTLLARFPDTPTKDERQKLNHFINLFAELYPCGECSFHLQKIIKKYPAQTSSRTAASLWGCHIHNIVNKQLKKPEYDCSTILEDYDCGCGDDNKNIKLNKVSIEKEQKQLG